MVKNRTLTIDSIGMYVIDHGAELLELIELIDKGLIDTITGNLGKSDISAIPIIHNQCFKFENITHWYSFNEELPHLVKVEIYRKDNEQ